MSVLNIPQIHFNLDVFEHILVAGQTDQDRPNPFYVLRDFAPNRFWRKISNIAKTIIIYKTLECDTGIITGRQISDPVFLSRLEFVAGRHMPVSTVQFLVIRMRELKT